VVNTISGSESKCMFMMVDVKKSIETKR